MFVDRARDASNVPGRWLRDAIVRPPAGGEGRARRYAEVALGGAALIWGLALIMLALMSPSYTSEWTLILPGRGLTADFSVGDIGQASSSSASPYGSLSRSPRVNYKEIINSRAVIRMAAEELSMPAGQFGRARIKLVQQSSLMQLSIEAGSGDLAQRKAYALLSALESTLSRLRNDELGQRESGMQVAMRQYAENLSATRAALLEHQGRTGMVSDQHYEELVSRLNLMEADRVTAVTERDRLLAYVARLSRSLGVDERFAADAVVLQADEAFSHLATEYAGVSAELGRRSTAFGARHPRILSLTAQRDSLSEALRERASELVGHDAFDYERLLMLDVGTEAGRLFKELVVAAAQLAGVRRQVAVTAAELDALRTRIGEKIDDVSVLADLARDHQVAEAVFSSALARIDTGKADLFVSYPLVQRVTEPSLPDRPDRRRMAFVLAGALGATLSLLTGLVLAWFRAPIFSR